MANIKTAQSAIDALRAKQGSIGSIDPNFHATTLQEIKDGLLKMFLGDGLIEFDAASAYAKDDYVIRTDDDALFQANDAITAGVWNALEWTKVDLKELGDPASIVARIESLTGDNRLDINSLKNVHFGSPSIQGNLKRIADAKGLVNGSPMDVSDVAEVFEALGVAGVTATGTWYIYIGATYSIGATAGNVIIPQSEFLAARELMILFKRRVNSGNRDIRVSAGPSFLSPIKGQAVNIYNNYAETRWDIPQSPAGNVTIYLRDVVVGGTYLVDPQHSIAVDNTEELRGGARPTQHNTGASYNLGDQVYDAATNMSWTCRRDGVTGTLNGADWSRAALLEMDEDQVRLDAEVVALHDDIDVSNGYENNLADYDAVATSYAVSDKVHEPTRGRNYKAKFIMTAPVGVFNEDNWSDLSNEGIEANKLDDAPNDGKTYGRKDAAWAEVVSSGASTPPITKVVNPSGKWVDMIVWDALIPAVSPAVGAEFIVFGQRADGSFLFHSQVHLFGSRTTNNGVLKVDSRFSDYAVAGTQAGYRLVREATDAGSKLHLQFFSGVDEDLTVTMVNNLNVPYGNDVVFGELTTYTDIAGQVISEELDVSDWAANDISSGRTAGIVVESVGDTSTNGSHLNFLPDRIEHYVGQSKTMESYADGTLISGSSGQTFDSPRYFYTSTALPDITAVATEFGDMVLHPMANGGASWSADIQNAYSGAAVPGFTMTTNAESMMFGITSNNVGAIALGNVTVELEIDLVTASAGGSFNFTDSSGNVIRTGVLPVPSEKGEYFRMNIAFPNDGIIQVDRIGSGFIGVISAKLNVIEATVSKQDHLVLDLHSNSRAFGLPKPIDTGLTPFEDGNLRSHPIDGRPQAYRRGDWSEIPTTRFKVNATSHIASYYADLADGDYLAQGCEEAPRPADLTVVNDQYDYPTLLKIIDGSSSGSGVLARNFDTDFETSMRDNGFEWTTNYRHDVGLMYLWLHVGTTYDGTAGRWLVSLTRSGTDVAIASVSGGGGTVTVPADKVIKYVLKCEAGSSTADLEIDGKFAFTVGKQANTSYSTGRWEITSGSSASTDEVGYILSTTLYSSNNPTVTLTRDEIEASVSLIIPSSPLPVDVIVPKGTYPVGTTLAISGNGDTLRAETGDPQSFDGQTTANIDGNIAYTQTDFPRGNAWRSDSKKVTTVHSQGNTLFVTVNAAGILQSRHGNYLGDIAIARTTGTGVGDGEWTIVPTEVASHVFQLDNTFMGATVMDTTQAYNATCRFALGFPEVNTHAEDNSPVDADFSVTLMW